MASSFLRMENCVDLQEWEECFIEAPPTIFTLRKCFTILLRYFYGNPNNFGEFSDAVGCLTYSDSEKDSALHIAPGGTHDPGNTENVPGILVSIGDGISYSKEWIDAKGTTSPDFASHTNVRTATVKLTFIHRHIDAEIAGIMCDLTTMFITAIEEKIRRTFNWVRGYDIDSQTEPKRARKATDPEAFEDFYESMSTLTIVYTYSVFVAEESKRLKDYSIMSQNERKTQT